MATRMYGGGSQLLSANTELDAAIEIVPVSFDPPRANFGALLPAAVALLVCDRWAELPRHRSPVTETDRSPSSSGHPLLRGDAAG